METEMTKKTYEQLEAYMKSCMQDSAHDMEHIYRVLYTALDIADHEKDVDYDVLICACLLHDIGRKAQFENKKVCHAKAGAAMAVRYLTEQGFDKDYTAKVEHCILAHRFRKGKGNQPDSTEAKILFDADKIDVTGAVGVARTLQYGGHASEPIYTRLPDGRIADGERSQLIPFFMNTDINYVISMKNSIRKEAVKLPGSEKPRQRHFIKVCTEKSPVLFKPDRNYWSAA